MSKKVVLNRIIKFSNVDGPGNRMAIFFQGCNFDCKYCHNPETIKFCNSCGRCLEVCPTNALFRDKKGVHWNEKSCVECDECIKNCQNSSSPKTKLISVEDLIQEIEKVNFFIKGITVSGGECSLNSPFLVELFKKVKQLYPKLSCYVDTNGGEDFQEERFKEFVDITDYFMLDIKGWDKTQHQELTGVENLNVIKNLQYLKEIGKLYEVRTVVVPNLLNNEECIDKVSEIISGTDIRYKIIKYRHYGVRQEFKNQLSTPSDEYLKKLELIAKEKGVKNIILI